MNDLKNNLTYWMQRFAPRLFQILVLAISAIGASHTYAGTLFYNAIPPSDSDANSGISTANQYTSAVDGGNTGGPERVINGITLYALSANGQTSTADNCTVTALAGTLANGGGSTASIQADGTLKDVLASMTFNNDASDNSQQEIVLDPSSLEPGATYDLRVYVGNSSGQNRQVNLAFVGDGQAPLETGFFNEDDATTSRGGFTDPNQAYYINYRYTWDGESTPGITITQKSASAPFCLYALTNQVVSSGEAAAQAAGGEAPEPAASDEGGLSAGFVNTESDQVGVASDDFYNSESLNKHGRWVKMDKWGASWQPTNVPSGWSPYTNGNFQYCDDCGWTFASDEPWAWATYHYGRWARVHSGCGWAWIPGKVWAGSWVSWRSGGDAIGWAPLPPEAGCELGVGISTWADHEYDIGPDYYTFINVRDFGSDSYLRGGFIFDRGRNVTIINQTINITNIAYNRSVTYAGGPNFFNLNQAIQRQGGRPIATVNLSRLNSRRIQGGVAATHTPRIAETLGSDKIDKGWPKDPKIQNDLRKHIAEQTRGHTPKTTRATVPPDVAQNVQRKHGGPQPPGVPPNQHPGPQDGPGPVTKSGDVNRPQHPGGPVTKSGDVNRPQHPGGPVTKSGDVNRPQHPGGPVTKSGDVNRPQHPGGPVTKSGDVNRPQHPGGPVTKSGDVNGPQHPGGPVTKSGDVNRPQHPGGSVTKSGDVNGPQHGPGPVTKSTGDGHPVEHHPKPPSTGPVTKSTGDAQPVEHHPKPPSTGPVTKSTGDAQPVEHHPKPPSTGPVTKSTGDAQPVEHHPKPPSTGPVTKSTGDAQPVEHHPKPPSSGPVTKSTGDAHPVEHHPKPPSSGPVTKSTGDAQPVEHHPKPPSSGPVTKSTGDAQPVEHHPKPPSTGPVTKSTGDAHSVNTPPQQPRQPAPQSGGGGGGKTGGSGGQQGGGGKNKKTPPPNPVR